MKVELYDNICEIPKIINNITGIKSINDYFIIDCKENGVTTNYKINCKEANITKIVIIY